MTRANANWPLLLLALSLVLSSCGEGQPQNDAPGHAAESQTARVQGTATEREHTEDDHARDAAHGHAEGGHEEASGAEYEEGKGILLAEPARAMIGLESAVVTEQKLALDFQATARVFHAAHQHGNGFPGHKDGHAYANAIIASAMANRLEVGQRVQLTRPARIGPGKLEGQLNSLDHETARAIGQVEAVIEIPDPDERLEFGAFLSARFEGAERTAMVIPRPALVDAATGTFVYVQNGERWLRTPVKAGGANESYVEILDGLFEGDIVVSKGAIDLWLIQLRFTKGGGHSH